MLFSTLDPHIFPPVPCYVFLYLMVGCIFVHFPSFVWCPEGYFYRSSNGTFRGWVGGEFNFTLGFS